MRDAVDDLGELWEAFAESECRGYSPLYERISRKVARDRDLLQMIRLAPAPAHQPNVLMAAVHYLVLGGLEHPLADVYAGRTAADPAPLFRQVCLDHREEILELMRTRRTQTNECGRSAAIGPALTWVAKRLGEPLALVDVGASAGLNLICDRYRLDYSEHGATGPPDAAVRVACRVVSGDPPIAPLLPPIAARVGIDRDPVDLGDADRVRWLLACVWPDTGRLERTSAAIGAAQLDPPSVIEGDAVAALPAVLADLPPDLVPCVLTTWAFAYLRGRERAQFAEVLEAAGRRRPLAWISAEGPGIVERIVPVDPPVHGGPTPSVLGAVVVDEGGSKATLLGYVHPHGAWLDWRAMDSAVR